MNVKQTIGSGAQALWRMGWQAWFLYALLAFGMFHEAQRILQATSYAGRAYHGGMLLICLSWLLQPVALSTRMLGQSLGQQYEWRRESGGGTQLMPQRVLTVAALGLWLLSLVFWLSSR